MVLKSRFTAAVPECSVQKWIFGSSVGPLPDKKIWIDPDHPDEHFITLEQARLLAKRIAVGLRERGLQPGDRVLLYCHNSIYYPVLVLAIWMAGGIFTGANPAFVARELAHQLKDSGACMLIAAEHRMQVALRAAEAVGMSKDSVFLFDDQVDVAPMAEGGGDHVNASGPCPHWSELIASTEKGAAFEWDEPEDSKCTTCAINYSSGTTGLPKGVELTHFNIVSNAIGMIQLTELRPNHKILTQRAAALGILPLYHAYGLEMFIALMPHEHIPVYIMPVFDYAKMLAYIERFRITILFAVPPVYVHMAKDPSARRADLSSLETVGCGAAPLPVGVQEEINRMLPPGGATTLRQAWGMTELTCSAIAWDPRLPPTPGVGELAADCRAKLVDVETGTEICEAKKPGELWISSPSIMRGYWRNPRATAESIRVDGDGTRWLRTGDVGYVGEYRDGAIFHIIDRIKELIKVKGFQVAPAELEALLLEREDIDDVAVIGIDAGDREFPRAYVVKSPASTATAHDITTWLAERVARYKRLKGGVVFVDSIPKTPSGKILRKVLRERARQDMTIRARL